MADQPWFKMYAADYLLDSALDAIPREAEGLLVRMWCVCHREGSCPADPETLARKTLCTPQYVLQYQSHCQKFFEEREGRLFSPRMEQEKRRSNQASENARKRYDKIDKFRAKSNSKSNSKPNTESYSESESESDDGKAVGNAIVVAANGSADGSANGSAKSAGHFVPPTLEEVTAYCKDHPKVNPVEFWNHYEANGWYRGKTKIKRWKAAIAVWEQHAGGFNGAVRESKAEALRRKNEAAAEQYRRECAANNG